MGKVFDMTIDDAATCERCGGGGRVNGGICLDCINEILGHPDSQKIGSQAFQFDRQQILANLIDNWMRIDRAFLRCEGALTVNNTVKFSIAANGKLDVEVGIKFKESEVNDKAKAQIDEKQLQVPGVK